MTIEKILEESKWQFMSHEAFNAAMDKLSQAKILAELVAKNYEDSADWTDAKPKLTKLAKALLV